MGRFPILSGQVVLSDSASGTRQLAEKLGVRVQQQLQICLDCMSKSKNCDKPINYGSPGWQLGLLI